MQFFYDSGVYKVARVASSQHNFLGIGFADSKENIEVVELPIKNGERRAISGELVLAQVMAGLHQMNDELGAQYHIEKVLFVPSDTPSDLVYKFLTIELIKRLHNKENFVGFPNKSI